MLALRAGRLDSVLVLKTFCTEIFFQVIKVFPCSCLICVMN